MSQAAAVEITDFLSSHELGPEVSFEEVEGRLAPMGAICCDTVSESGEPQLCCGTGPNR